MGDQIPTYIGLCKKCNKLPQFAPGRYVCKECRAAYRADHYRRNLELMRERARQQRLRRKPVNNHVHPPRVQLPEPLLNKVRARGRVAYAVKRGLLPRVKTLACTDCDNEAKYYDHFRGYDRENWLSVEPVCVECSVRRSCVRGEIKWLGDEQQAA